MFIADTPEKIHFFRLCSLRSMLRMEMRGMRFKASCSAATAVKQVLGLSKRCRNQTALDALNVEIERLQQEREAACTV